MTECDPENKSNNGNRPVDERPYNKESVLRRLYHSEDLTVQEIADETGCSTTTVSKRFKQYGIDTDNVGRPRSNGPNKWRDRAVLKELYHQRGLSTQEIAVRLGCGRKAVSFWLLKHDLKKYASEAAGEVLGDAETMRSLYVDQGFSADEIADATDFSARAVRRSLAGHGIDTGEVSDADLIDEIHRLHDDLGRPPFAMEMDRDGDFGYWLYHDRFGGWYEAVVEAGYTPSRQVAENHPNWEGRAFPYGSGWSNAKKELVRERDGRECQICGKPEAEHLAEYGEKHTVHHIVKARVLQDAPSEIRNGTFNLVTVCCSHNGGALEQIHPWIQFMAFLPHPPLPTEQTTLLESTTDD